MRRVILQALTASITLIIGVLAVYVWLWQPPSASNIAEFSRPAAFEIQTHPESLGWDLTYVSVLERNYVPRREFIWKWLNYGYQGPGTRTESPAERWIAEWQGEPIVSSILIEFPAPHAGEHMNEWFVRTENHAYYWSLVENDRHKLKKQELNPQVYDNLFAQLSPMQQAVPPRVEDLSSDTPPGEAAFFTGYTGFLSLYENGESRQMLLIWNDFVGCNSKECCRPECKTLQSGRLLSALEPVF